MEKYYHGAGKRGPYFEGWYLKCQTREGAALALIPACHIDREGRRSASLQVVADGEAWWLAYPDAEFRAFGEMFCVRVGRNLFTRRQMCLDIEGDGLSLHGTMRCGPFTPLRSDIMGPFRFLPAMECAHGVLSMAHPLEGSVTLNGKTLDFSGAGAVIRQGKYRLSAELLKGEGCPLRAPAGGVMGRTVRESLCATVRYRFWAGETLLLDRTDRCAGFEYAENRGRS